MEAQENDIQTTYEEYKDNVKRKHLRCTCGSEVLLVEIDWSNVDKESQWYIDPVLFQMYVDPSITGDSFWSRLKNAVRYVFGKPIMSHAIYSEIRDAREVAEWILEYTDLDNILEES